MSANRVKSIKYNLIEGGLALGCRIKGGKILPALSAGLKDTSCPGNVKYAAFAHYSDSIFAMTGDSLYKSVESNQYLLSAIAAAKMPFLVEYNDGNKPRSAVVFNTKSVYYLDSGSTVENNRRNICGGVYKNGRVFGIDLSDSYKLWWSGEKGIKDWEERIDGAGWLYTDTELGEIYNLLVFKGELAVIKKFGITLLNVGGTPEDFKQTVAVPTPAIYQNCSVVCGNKLYFYTTDGLYAFNGSAAEKVEIDGTSDFTSAVYGMTHGTCLFFAGTHNGLEKGVILVYDTKDATHYFIDAAATALVAANNLYAYVKGGVVKLERGNPYTYRSEEFGHFSKRKKTLESIFIDCNTGVDLTVQTESGSRLFKGVKGKVLTRARGAHFKVSVTGTDAEIREMSATVEYY